MKINPLKRFSSWFKGDSGTKKSEAKPVKDTFVKSKISEPGKSPMPAMNKKAAAKSAPGTKGGTNKKISLAEAGALLFESSAIKIREFVVDGGLGYRKPVVLKDGNVAIGAGNGFVTRLGVFTPTGKKLWTSLESLERDPVVDKDGNFFFSKKINTVSVDKNGKLRWKFDRNKKAPDYRHFESDKDADCTGCTGRPAVDEKRNRVYFGEHYGRFVCLDKDSGEMKWMRVRPGMIISCNPQIDKNGNVYFYDHNGHMISLKPNGEENWIIGAGDKKCYPEGTKVFDEKTQKWMKDVGKSRLNEMDFNTRSKKGQHGAVAAGPVLVNDDKNVIFGMDDGRVLSIDAKTGKLDSFFDVGEKIHYGPIDAGEGRVIVAGDDGRNVCLNTNEKNDGKYGPEMKAEWDAMFDGFDQPCFVDQKGRCYYKTLEGILVVNNKGEKEKFYEAKITAPPGMAPNGEVVFGAGEKLVWIDIDKPEKEKEKKEEQKLKGNNELIETENEIIIGGVKLDVRKS